MVLGKHVTKDSLEPVTFSLATGKRRNSHGAYIMSKQQTPTLFILEKYTGAEFLPLYVTSVKVTEGLSGNGKATVHARSDDVNLDIVLRLPEALGKSDQGATPEQLFAAALGACFHGVLTLQAVKLNIKLTDCVVDAKVAFGRDPVDGLFMLAAEVQAHLPGIPSNFAEELVRNAERICPYSKMAKHGIIYMVALAG